MQRKDNTLQFLGQEGGTAKYIPIETIDSLYVFGSLDVNTAMLSFLGQEGVHLHVFDYYEHYTGSFAPRDHLLAGEVHLSQSKAYLNGKKRLGIAKEFILAGSFNILQNLKYYDRREKPLEDGILSVEHFRGLLEKANSVEEVMGLEGNIRQVYYRCFDLILNDFEMGERTKRPPKNEVNALISFGNSMCYSAVLSAIYHTQLNPTISFLHEPGARRYSLALDLAEVFKPVLVDRAIFKLLNKRVLQAKHFDKTSEGCWLNMEGRKLFVRDFDERLQETIQHRSLKRKVSYKRLLQLECYKLSKYVMGISEEYRAFRLR
jgi:CRISPR-associated protein Cas1